MVRILFWREEGAALSGNTSSVFVSILGRPNVGKSSLLNRLVGEKTAIVTPKPQTTRTRITGILTQGTVQYVFYDTPGLHAPHTRLGGCMMKAAEDSVGDGDVALMLFDPKASANKAEQNMLKTLRQGGVKAVAAVNKADTVRNGELLAEKAAELTAWGVFDTVAVVSAVTGEGCEGLLQVLADYAAAGPHFFAGELFTDQPEKQLVAEIVREKLLLNLHEEIPHGTAVEVERFSERESGGMIDIDVAVYCEKSSHKGMLIGKGGAMLKKIATEARREIEALLGAGVNMRCWVKVRSGWRDNEAMLRHMGFAGK